MTKKALADEHGARHRYGTPAFHDLLLWLWTSNANGRFNDWNPAVRCP